MHSTAKCVHCLLPHILIKSSYDHCTLLSSTSALQASVYSLSLESVAMCLHARETFNYASSTCIRAILKFSHNMHDFPHHVCAHLTYVISSHSISCQTYQLLRHPCTSPLSHLKEPNYLAAPVYTLTKCYIIEHQSKALQNTI